jgi:hypothetical protein
VCLAVQTLVDVLPAESTMYATAAPAVQVKAQLLASTAPGRNESVVVALVTAVHRYVTDLLAFVNCALPLGRCPWCNLYAFHGQMHRR